MKEKKLRFKKEDRCKGINSDGSEVCDSKPTELRAQLNAPVTMRQKMRNLWQEFRIKEQESNEFESIIDASDFDVDNDVMPSSPYESEGSLNDAINDAPSEQIQTSDEQEVVDNPSPKGDSDE